MNMRLSLFVSSLLAFVFTAAATVPAMAATDDEKKARVERVTQKLDQQATGGKNANEVGLAHRWSFSGGVGYNWSSADVDQGVHWIVEAQKRVSTYGVVGLGVEWGNHDLQTAPGDMDVVDVMLSYVRYVPEDTYNRQPNFYYGAGLDILGTSVDGAGSTTDIGAHVRAGVEFKGGIYTEFRYVFGPEKGKYNDARLGGFSVSAGYRAGI